MLQVRQPRMIGMAGTGATQPFGSGSAKVGNPPHPAIRIQR